MPTWLLRQKYLIDFTLSSLLRRRAKNLGLLLVYTLIVFVLASVMLFTHALRQEAALVLEGAPEIVSSGWSPGVTTWCPRRLRGAHRAVRGVRRRRVGSGATSTTLRPAPTTR